MDIYRTIKILEREERNAAKNFRNTLAKIDKDKEEARATCAHEILHVSPRVRDGQFHLAHCCICGAVRVAMQDEIDESKKDDS